VTTPTEREIELLLIEAELAVLRAERDRFEQEVETAAFHVRESNRHLALVLLKVIGWTLFLMLCVGMFIDGVIGVVAQFAEHT
jgi:hypothetical protein